MNYWFSLFDINAIKYRLNGKSWAWAAVGQPTKPKQIEKKTSANPINSDFMFIYDFHLQPIIVSKSILSHSKSLDFRNMNKMYWSGLKSFNALNTHILRKTELNEPTSTGLSMAKKAYARTIRVEEKKGCRLRWNQPLCLATLNVVELRLLLRSAAGRPMPLRLPNKRIEKDDTVKIMLVRSQRNLLPCETLWNTQNFLNAFCWFSLMYLPLSQNRPTELHTLLCTKEYKCVIRMHNRLFRWYANEFTEIRIWLPCN